MKDDEELKDYLNELSADGTSIFGAYGKVNIERSAFSFVTLIFLVCF